MMIYKSKNFPGREVQVINAGKDGKTQVIFNNSSYPDEETTNLYVLENMSSENNWTLLGLVTRITFIDRRIRLRTNFWEEDDVFEIN
jgi:hypothetical protein